MLTELLGVKVDPEVAAAVEATGKTLAGMGHTVEPARADIGGLDALRAVNRPVLLRLRRAPRRLRQAHRRQDRPRHAGARDPRRSTSGRRASRPHASWAHLPPPTPPAARSAQIFAQLRRHGCRRPHRASPSPGATINLSKPGVSAANIVDELFAIPVPVHGAAQHHGHARDVAAARHALDRRADRRADRGQTGRRACAAPARHRARAGHALDETAHRRCTCRGCKSSVSHIETFHFSRDAA